MKKESTICAVNCYRLLKVEEKAFSSFLQLFEKA